MKKWFSPVLQSNAAPSFESIEAKRTSGIHLVMPLQALPDATVAVPKINRPWLTSRRSRYIRESEKVNMFALAGAALAAPAIWLGHALLVWMKVL
jgi:hypothetical protein